MPTITWCAYVWLAALGDEDKLRSEIEALRKELGRCLERLDSMEKRLAASQESKKGSPPLEPPQQDPLEQSPKWNELTVGKSAKLKFYGFLRLDAVYDDSRPDNTQIIGSVKSEDPAADPSVAAKENDHDLTIHPRLTRLGIDFEGPKVEPLGGAHVTGKLEIDFYNLLPGALTSNSREFVRMRHAWLKLGWENFSLLAGQREDVISPIFPIVNNDLVLWGAGNLGDRRPQVRGEWTNGMFTATGMIGLTGADDNQNLDNDGLLDGEDSFLPTLQGRLAVALDGWVAKQKIVVGIWGHWAREETSKNVAGFDRFQSDAEGLDLTIPLLADLWLKGELWRGQNLDDVRGGIFQGVNTTTGDEIASFGGWIELGWRPVEWYAVSLGASLDDPEHDDLPVAGKDLNRIFYLANRFTFGPVEFGADYLNWTTEYKGFGEGTDNRFNVYAAFKF